MNDRIIWIGNRESEILYSTLFYKSITRYGSNKGNNISHNHNKKKSFVDFLVDSINMELKHAEAKLFFYSYTMAEYVIEKAPYLQQHIINKYNANFLKLIENKTYSHLWASNILPVLEFTEMFGNECSYSNVSHKFVDKEKFVIQDNYSSGGVGTFLLTKENEKNIIQQLDRYKCYMVSPYYENSYSVNVHIIIADNYTAVLQPSIQIIENINDRLLYKGADFIAFTKIAPEISIKVIEYATNIGNSLHNNGYLGICGLDLLVIYDEVFFVEINTRFQASSLLINCALKFNNLPDLQTIIYDIYNGRSNLELLKKIEKLNIGFSMLSFYQNESREFNKYLLQLMKNTQKNIDKLIIENEYANTVGDYMFRVIFTTNISSINFEGNLFVYQNLLNYSNFTAELYRKSMFNLKCALLTQGVRISQSVSELYINGKTIKKATFDAIDITIDGENVINCPINTKFVELSPFSIQRKGNETALFYLDQCISIVSIAEQEQLPIKITQNNIGIHRIGYLTTDRLRIKHTTLCKFKAQNQGCKFCHITCNSNEVIPLEDIYETIAYYQKCTNFRHYLIGGPSNTYDNEAYYVENIAKYIRSTSDKPIYVMSIPPVNCDTLKCYYEAGVTEVAFNIEIFDRKIAKIIMPGKGDISIKQYENALKKSSQIFGVRNTRSMLIIGLDSKESFLSGIEYLCQLGVTPMISPFRPMDNTELSDIVPPTIEYILDTYSKSKEICSKYRISLGPSCIYCQNNTLT